MEVWTQWSLDPLRWLPLAVLALMYLRRARTLARRGAPVPGWRQGLFLGGLALAALAVVSPLDRVGEERLFAAHMVQHVLLGDLAALALVAGLTGPLLRPVLALAPVERLRFLAHPLVALPLWAANLLLWHLPVAYEAALANGAVHVLQHVLFLTLGALMWAPVVEVLPGPAWFGTGLKFGYIVVVRLITTVLGNVLIWTETVLYDPYARAERLWGISPLADQGIAGSVMLVEGSVVTLAALAWLFLRAAREGETRQRLLEAGVDPRTAARAVRYGRAQELECGTRARTE